MPHDAFGQWIDEDELRYPKDAPISYRTMHLMASALDQPVNPQKHFYPDWPWYYEDVIEHYSVEVIAWAYQFAHWYNNHVHSSYDSFNLFKVLRLAQQVQSDPAALDRWRQARAQELYDQHWDYEMNLWARSLWYGLLAGLLSSPFWFAGTLAYASHPALFHQKNVHATIYSILTGLGVAGVSRWIQWRRKQEDIKSWLFAALLLGPVLIFVAFLL